MLGDVLVVEVCTKCYKRHKDNFAVGIFATKGNKSEKIMHKKLQTLFLTCADLSFLY